MLLRNLQGGHFYWDTVYISIALIAEVFSTAAAAATMMMTTVTSMTIIN